MSMILKYEPASVLPAITGWESGIAVTITPSHIGHFWRKMDLFLGKLTCLVVENHRPLRCRLPPSSSAQYLHATDPESKSTNHPGHLWRDTWTTLRTRASSSSLLSSLVLSDTTALNTSPPRNRCTGRVSGAPVAEHGHVIPPATYGVTSAPLATYASPATYGVDHFQDECLAHPWLSMDVLTNPPSVD